MWAYETNFYQLYPLGFCAASWENDGVCRRNIREFEGWIGHLKALGTGAVYFSPVFESDSHGYDTRDYRRIDSRLGSNEDFAHLCAALRENGIRVVLDGVFNHVGRGFWAFRDVQEKREASPYRDWFHISFEGNSNYNDGFWYEGWEGHYELVKLNLANSQVQDYLFDAIRWWVEAFGIDGLRLDVAYCLDREFLRRLRGFCDSLGREFFLVGEMLHGDYNQLVNPGMLHSVTNYECYKGLYSSFNSMNLFEIAHSLQRQFGPENWCLYRRMHLLSFVDNHDVSRIASQLTCREHLPLIYGLLYGMPGIPCLYYGSEWGAEGVKQPGGDQNLRPAFGEPQWTPLTDAIAAMAAARLRSPALRDGDYRSLAITNRQLVFQRQAGDDRVIVAVNADSQPYTAHFNANAGRARDLITGQEHDFGGGSVLPPCSVRFWQVF